MTKGNPDLNSREGIISFLKEKKARAVYVKDFPFLFKGSGKKEDIIYFKPRVFGKSTTKIITRKLGLKTKRDCEELNKILKK